MANEVIARQYGRAYYDATKQEGIYEAAVAQLEELADILRLAEVQRVWRHPIVASETKMKLVEEFLGGTMLPVNQRFISLLISKKRELLLDGIIEQIQQIDRDVRGILIAELTSAYPLEEEAEQKLVERLKKRYGKEIELERKVDPGVLGGFSCRVGDAVYDGTLKRRLARMREYLLPQFRV